jgi:hypothetical protein
MLWVAIVSVVTLLQGLWFGEAWSKHLTAAVLVGMLVVGVALASRTFRWE